MKSYKTRCVAAFVLTLLFLAARIFVGASLRDTIIIQAGLKGYFAIKTGLTCLTFGCFCPFLYFLIKIVTESASRKKEEEKKALNEVLEEEKKRMEDGRLSVFGELSDEYVMKEVTRQGLNKWSQLKSEIEVITDQLLLMNSYQERLTQLLVNNSAQSLSESEELVSKMEQQILLNVRKVLNYMEIFGQEDIADMRKLILSCAEENTKLLSSTKDFLICITNFLNNQGGYEGRGLQMVEDFKKILETSEK